MSIQRRGGIMVTIKWKYIDSVMLVKLITQK